jgi:hypothetical protein
MNDRLLVVLLAIMGSLMVFYGVRKIFDASATASWPTATATILAAEVGKARGAGSYVWVADLVFRYTVGTTTYTSSRYSAAREPGFFLRRTAERIVQQHQPGTRSLVAYPRSDPSLGILAPGVRPVLIAALRIIASGLAALYLSWNFF